MKAKQIIKCTKVGVEDNLHGNQMHEGKMMVLEIIQGTELLSVCTGKNRFWGVQSIIQLVNDGYEFELIEDGKVIGKFNNMFNDPWEPRENTWCAHITECGHIDYNYSESEMERRKKVGNCFETKEIAQHEAKRESLVRRLRNFARANGGFGDYAIAYDKRMEYICWVYVANNFYLPWDVMYSSQAVAEEAIKRYGNGIIELYKEESR